MKLHYTVIIYIFIFFSIIAVNKIRTKKIANDPKVQSMISQVQLFLLDIEKNKKEYFTNSAKEKMKSDYRELYYKLTNGELKKITTDESKKFIEIYNEIDNLIKEWNKQYIEKELVINEALLSNIDGKSLDEQQRRAVVVDEDNNLVLAGAGSGKTLTIAAKVKYIIQTKNIDPKEILLISFTKKAADEMNERIKEKLGLDVQAITFHKLGLDIASEHRGKRPDVAEELLEEVIEDYFKDNIYYDSKILENLIMFFGYYINIPKEIDSFENIGDYYKYCKNIDYTTLKGKSEIYKINKLHIEELKKDKKTIKGEKVKSIEEVIIANFLYLNGVEYKYEEKYPYETGDKYKKTYKPDFYLPEYDIYIEHFGVNRNNKAPQLSRIEEQKYIEDMKWKKELHRNKNTTLIETYSYYQSEGILLQTLRSKLINNGVCLKEVDYKETYKTIYENKEDKYFKELRKLIGTFITLYKSRGNDLQDFNNLYKEVLKIPNKFIRERNNILLDLIKPIYIKYEGELYKNGKIDFNDMINESTELIKCGKVTLNYKYIIIDEYQDISKSRFSLIKAIKDVTNAKLVCVGDDWQSIYRFAGSDIDLFTNFKDYVGDYELLKIEKTYRNSQDLIDIAGKFVLKNKNQIDKNLKSDKIISNPIKIITYRESSLAAFEKSIDDIVSKYGTHSEITLLGRNNYDINFLSKEATNGEFLIKKKSGDQVVESKKYPYLKIKFLTVHKSKGLESENVIILNLENKTSGFPNQIEDDPILNLVLTRPEDYMFAEERRLFYVALTRTKNNCYLIVPEMRASIFYDEIIEDFKLRVECVDTKGNDKIVKCPKCLVGSLVHRKSDARGYSFVSCNNYPVCDFKSNSIEILDNPIICKSCGGFMIKRESYGETFLGCTNYPYCRNKEIYEDDSLEELNQEVYDKYSCVQYQSNMDYYQISKEERVAYYDAYNDYVETELNAIIEEERISVEENDKTIEDSENKDSFNFVDNEINTSKYESDDYNNTSKLTDKRTVVDLYIRDRYDGHDEFYNTCTVDRVYKVGDKFKYNNKNFIVTARIGNSLHIKHEVVKKDTILNSARYRADLYIKNIEDEEFKYYVTCTLDNKYTVGETLVYDNTEFTVIDIWDDNIFIKPKENQVEKQELSTSAKKYIELYIEDKDTYRYYTTCITDTELRTGDTIKDYNKYFIVNELNDDKVYLRETNGNSDIFGHSSEHTKKILTLYLENDYYKKYLTDINYSINDTIVNENNEFIVTDIFKDTIFMQVKEEQELNKNKGIIEEKRELLEKQIEAFRIKKIKTQLFDLRNNSYIIWDERLWIDGLIEYIEGNLTRYTFCDSDILDIIYYDKLLNEEWILQQIDYLKKSDILGYRKMLSSFKNILNNENKIDYYEDGDYYYEEDINNKQYIKKYILNCLKCSGEKCAECNQDNFICKDCDLYFD